jgi:HEAT repeat protein
MGTLSLPPKGRRRIVYGVLFVAALGSALYFLQPKESVAKLTECVRSDAAAGRRMTCIYRLGELRSKASAAVPELIELVKAPEVDKYDAYIKTSAVIALGKIGSQSAVPAIRDYMATVRRESRHFDACKRALEKLGE